MVTELTNGKVVRRRLGDLVITLSAEGVALRRPGCRRTALVPVEELEAVLRRKLRCEPTRTRDRAFAEDLPPWWIPQLGDEVFLRTGSPVKGRVVFCRPDLPETVVRVRRRGREDWHNLSDLRAVKSLRAPDGTLVEPPLTEG